MEETPLHGPTVRDRGPLVVDGAHPAEAGPGPAPVLRRRLWVAVALSVAAVPLLVLDNRSDDDGAPVEPPRNVTAVVVPVQRSAVGPPKGVSVVTTSTTASPLPITTLPATTAPATTAPATTAPATTAPATTVPATSLVTAASG